MLHSAPPLLHAGEVGPTHSLVHNAHRGREINVTWGWGDEPNFFEWSATKEPYEGLIPDLFGAVSEELGVRFNFRPAPRLVYPADFPSEGSPIVDPMAFLFITNQTQPFLGSTLSYYYYGPPPFGIWELDQWLGLHSGARHRLWQYSKRAIPQIRVTTGRFLFYALDTRCCRRSFWKD